MSDIPQQKSNWLAVMTIAIIVLSASGIGYYHANTGNNSSTKRY